MSGSNAFDTLDAFQSIKIATHFTPKQRFFISLSRVLWIGIFIGPLWGFLGAMPATLAIVLTIIGLCSAYICVKTQITIIRRVRQQWGSRHVRLIKVKSCN